MRTRRDGLSIAVVVVLTMMGGCSGATDPASNPTASQETAVDSTIAPTDDAPADPAPEPMKEESTSTDPTAGGAGTACTLLDPTFLTETMAGQKTTFGTDFEFVEPYNTTSEQFCQWKEINTGLSLELTLRPTAETDPTDHSERAYNIDSQPVAVPQDGPGTDAVLLTDTSFESLDSDALAYGYFFVQGDTTAYVKSVGLSIEPDFLRDIADEVSRRLMEA